MNSFAAASFTDPAKSKKPLNKWEVMQGRTNLTQRKEGTQIGIGYQDRRRTRKQHGGSNRDQEPALSPLILRSLMPDRDSNEEIEQTMVSRSKALVFLCCHEWGRVAYAADGRGKLFWVRLLAVVTWPGDRQVVAWSPFYNEISKKTKTHFFS